MQLTEADLSELFDFALRSTCSKTSFIKRAKLCSAHNTEVNENAMDTLVAVLNAIGYTEEFAAQHPDMKVSESVKLFLAGHSCNATQQQALTNLCGFQELAGCDTSEKFREKLNQKPQAASSTPTFGCGDLEWQARHAQPQAPELKVSIVQAGLTGLARHVRACSAYSKLIGDMEIVDQAIALLERCTNAQPQVPEPKDLTDEQFIAEHGHLLAKMLGIDDYYGIADRDAKIARALLSNGE